MGGTFAPSAPCRYVFFPAGDARVTLAALLGLNLNSRCGPLPRLHLQGRLHSGALDCSLPIPGYLHLDLRWAFPIPHIQDRLPHTCHPQTCFPSGAPRRAAPSPTPETWESAFTPSHAVSDRAQGTLFHQLPSISPAAAPLTTSAALTPTALGAPSSSGSPRVLFLKHKEVIPGESPCLQDKD